MKMEKNFKRWVFFFVLLPFSVFLVVLNVASWKLMIRNHKTSLTSVVESVGNDFDALLSTETVRLQNIGLLPNVDSLLASTERVRRNSLPQRRDQIESIRERWPNLQRDDYEVREILDNSVGEIFQRICANESYTAQLILTDADGQVVAASSKPDQYSYATDEWWIRAHTREQSQPVSDGLSSQGAMGISLAVRDSQRTNYVSGVLRANLVLSEMTSWLKHYSKASSPFIALVSTNFTLAITSDASDQPTPQSLLNSLLANPKPWAWKKGLRYSVRPLSAGITWQGPVYVVGVRKEALFSPSLYGSIFLMFALSILAFIGLKQLTMESGRKMFLHRYEEALTAGEWALQRLRGENAGVGLAASPSSLQPPDGSELSFKLDNWLESLRTDYREEATFRLYDIERDLSSAKDFQRSYLEKPYPKIPLVHSEGHLRFCFGHRYQMAVALGGDFFDIFPAASDCAGVFIADVMGHGTRSALITTLLRTLIKDFSKQGRNARLFMSELNKAFCHLMQSMPDPLFVSAFYLVGDATGRVATYCSAGHPAPFLARRHSRRITRLEAPDPRGSALGVVAQEDYTAGQCRLMADDLILLFTDGAYEARNHEGVAFGIDRMHETLERLLYHSKDEILDGVMKAILDFIGDEPLSDDICLVAIEVTDKAEPA